MGITIPEADGGQGGSLMDAVIAIEQIAAVCPRSADVVQFGNFGPIRTFAEYGTEYQKKKWLTECLAGNAGDQPRHERAGRRLGRDRSQDQRQAGRHELRRQRHQGVLDLQPGGRGLPGLCALRARRRRHRLGAGRARHAGLHHRPAAGVHERRAVERAAFRQLPHPGRERAARPRRLQEADGELQRRAARQHRALARVRPLLLRPGARARRRCASSSAGRCAEFQGLQWKFADMAIKLEGAQLLLYRAAANADKGLPSAYETAVAKAACNQTGFEVAHEAMQIMGAAGYSKTSLVEYCMRRCRGWMIAGGSIEMLKNRIAEHVFDRRFDQRPPKPKVVRGGRVTKPLAQVLLAPQSVAIIGQSNDADQDRRPAAEISAAGRLCRPHLSDQSAARRGAGRARLAVARRAAGGARARLYRRVDRGDDGGDRGMRPARRAGRHRARQRLSARPARKAPRARRGSARHRCKRPARASSARRASAWSTCGTRRSSPPTPRSTSRTCRSAASSPPRIPAA